MKNIFIIFILLISINNFNAFSQNQKVLEYAFSHNDYDHDKPLLDALNHGFNTVEADVHLINGKLYVYHDKPNVLDDNKTLENLYLNPLRSLIKKNKGVVYKNSQVPFYLMVDIKTDAKKTYRALKKVVDNYRDIFIYSKAKHNAVKIFISGQRAFKEILEDKSNIIALDGRVSDLGKGYSNISMPMISNSFSELFSWNGIGEMSKKELKLLREIIKKTNLEDKKLRFWGTPKTINAFELLMREKVDIVGTDDLELFKKLSSKSVTIMSFNIRYNNASDGKNRWDLRKELVIKNINSYSPDFIGLQEVKNSQFKYINQELTDKYSVIGRGRGFFSTEDEAVPIYYKKNRWILLTSGNFWLSTTPNIPASKSWNTACCRMASWGFFKSYFSDQQIVVVNTHLDHISVQARVNGIRLIVEELKKFGDKIPKVLMGDFNADPESKVYKTVVENTDLEDVYREVNKKITVNDNTFRGWKNNKGIERIDYIFTTKPKKIIKAVVDKGIIDNRYTSDHLPVIVEVKF